MSASPAFEQNLDVLHGTIEKFMAKEPILVHAYETYEDLNVYMKSHMQVTGDQLKGFVETGTVGNAGWTNPWAKDSLIVKNLTKEYTLTPYKHLKGGMAFNKMEVSANSGPEKIFDVVKLQYRKAKAEVVDKFHEALWSAPTSASDVDSPHGIPCWLTLGTQASTGGWTGYLGRYNDGSTPGASFNVGGLQSTSAIVPEHASYYADHEGNLDESMFRILNDALMRQNFKPPTLLDVGSQPKVSYACFTSRNVILTLNQLYFKLNSQVGPQPMSAGYYPLSNTQVPGAIPLVWSNILDTANVSMYGTDPIYGVNMSMVYPVYLKGWNFALSEDDAAERHLVTDKFIDYGGHPAWCDSRHHAGFLISSHPSN